jgi:A/G-specific adenine glycosylase
VTPLQDVVLEWAPSGWRELPWRRTRDPWAILVSELMLQQTQVSRVVPKWEAFMVRWPTAPACASDRQSEVIRAWAGLGYNRRALNLHRCAEAVTARHHGRLPANLAALEALPGIGPYTARAVLAFAFEHDVGVVDINAGRVISRAVLGQAPGRSALQQAADGVVPTGRAWAWNQAVLDLGATVCTARRPKCDACPLRGVCAWRRHGGPDPAARPAPAPAFEGSDRQARGRLLDALRRGPVPDPAHACGCPGEPHRSARIAAALVTDGFAVWEGSVLTLVGT